MTEAVMPVDVSVEPRSTTWTGVLSSRLVLCVALVLLAMAHVLLAGYQLGVGNQTIQIPFLKWFLDSRLYADDPMVMTVKDYPSFFFQGLAWLVGRFGLERTYLVLHFVAALGVISAAYWLVMVIFRDRLASVLMLLLLMMGHHQALGGDSLYSLGFTHTWFVFPIAIASLALLYRQRLLPAFLLAGIMFNLHALTASYLLFMFLFWCMCELRTVGVVRVLICLGVFLAAASPTVLEMARNDQVFGQEWIAITRIRSGDHSFPSNWWQTGTPDIPRFALLLGLFVLSLSFPAPRDRQRKSMIMAGAVLILFAAGIVFSEIKPHPLVVRAQLFRSSRLLMVIMFAHIAYATACMLRRPWSRFDVPEDDRGIAPPAARSAGTLMWMLWGLRAVAVMLLLAGSAYIFAARSRGMVFPYELSDLVVRRIAWGMAIGAGLLLVLPWRRDDWLGRWFDMIIALAVFAAVALPPLLPVLPFVLAGAIVYAWVDARLSWWQAILASAALLAILLSWNRIDFHIPFLPGESRVDFGKGWALQTTALIALAAGAGLWAVSSIRLRAWANLVFLLEGIAIAGLIGMHERHPLLGDAMQRDEWVKTQLWAKEHTDIHSMFLTPPVQSGFRVFSERPVVSEWRDGTQGYFTAKFAEDWWKRQGLLRPNMLADQSQRFLLNPGQPLASLTDDQLLKLTAQTKAQYIVLPTQAKGRGLKLAYANRSWSVYEPRSIVPPGVIDRDLWIRQDQFMTEVVQPNIEKYRKSDVKIEITDEDGSPLSNADYQVRQTKQLFGFGSSLAFFQPVEGSGPDYKPVPVDPRELELFPQVFNYSVIPFSAKWMYIEPVEGKRTFEELDKYVNWCTQQGIEMEFHYLTGMPPAWIRRKPSSVQADLVYKHCMELVERYRDRIRVFQVTNDSYFASYLGPVVRDIRAKYPQLQLGTSDCTGFYDTGRASSEDIYRGLEEVQAFKAAGQRLDYFAFHGHRPYGVWPDATQIYDTMNKFAAEGIQVRVSEAVFPLGGRAGGYEGRDTGDSRGLPAQILGPLRSGTWTPELQADFAEWFFTVCFSHPSCVAVNYWNFGPDSLLGGAGMLDDNYQPKPMFNRLKALIRGKWMTHIASTPLSDGEIAFRGFHGDYELTVTLADGRTTKATFSISPGGMNRYHLRLDSSKGVLEAIK